MTRAARFLMCPPDRYGVDYVINPWMEGNIRRVSREAAVQLAVGNLYINRGFTGALVGRQPFGEFKMSGGGTKAGGREYLLHFLLPRVVTENLIRRGFAALEPE